MECIKSGEYHSETTRKLNKNLSEPSALERTPACYPPANLLRLWDTVQQYAKKWQSGMRCSVWFTDSILTFCLLLRNEERLVLADSCETSRLCSSSSSSIGSAVQRRAFEVPMQFFSRGARPYRCIVEVKRGTKKSFAPGNDSLGEKSRVSNPKWV